MSALSTPVFGRVARSYPRPPLPPKLPEPPHPAPVLAWARRVVERVQADTLSGRLQWPRWDADDRTFLRDLDRMDREPMVATPTAVTVAVVAQLDLQVVPDDPDDPAQRQRAEFARYAFNRVRGGVPRILTDLLRPALKHGWSLSEKVYTPPLPAGPWAGKTAWEAWKSRDVTTITPKPDDFGNVAVYECPTPTGRQLLPAADFAAFVHRPWFESPTGQSLYRVAHRDWQVKQCAVPLWGLGLEKWGAPMLVGTYDDGTKQAALAAELEAAGSNRWLTVPTGVAVSALSAATSSAADWDAFVARADKQMAIAVMGSHLPVLEGAQANVAGDSRTQRGTAELLQWALSVDAAAVLTEQARQLDEFNFAGPSPLTVVLGAVSEADVAAMVANDSSLHAMGLPLSKRSLYRRTGREAPADDGDALAPPQPPAPPGGGGGFPAGFGEAAGRWVVEGEQGGPFEYAAAAREEEAKRQAARRAAGLPPEAPPDA